MSKRRNVVALPPFTRGDPITALLRGRLRVSPWSAALGWVLLVNVVVAIVASINDLWPTRDGRIGLLHDFTWWWMYLTSVPATVLFFLWMPDGIAGVLKGLRDNRAVVVPESGGDGEADYARFIDRFDRAYSHPVWVTICLVLILARTVMLALPEYSTYPAWFTAGKFIFWFTQSAFVLQNGIGALIGIRTLVVIAWFNRLFREFKINVKVLHPDGAGGLSPLGEFSVKVGYLIGVYGITFAVNMFGPNYFSTGQISGLSLSAPLAAGVVMYVVLAPVVFFAPIGAAHSAMKAAKDGLLLQIADQFEADSNAMEAALRAEPAELGKSLEKLDQLQKLHKMASSFPVWPFNTPNLVRFFSSTLSPVVIGLIPAAIDLIVRK